MGGGRRSPQTTTVSSGIDAEFKPYLERVLSDVTDTYEASVDDPSKTVAALDPAQTSALNTQEQLGQDAITGGGAFDYTNAMNRDIQNVVGSAAGQAALGGYGGSARAQKMMASAVGDKSMQYQQQRQRDIASGAKALGDVGSARQGYQQALLDAPHTQASRYFGYLGSAPQTQTQTTTGGGGK
tara:strand:+ start:3000 stop:3551 length:552 start_codon:yes stop_codon:yes gene_type:complete